jgi:hydrogenase 3 maturation protease
MRSPLEELHRLVAGRRFVVVGVGNPLRGDDGVGSWTARRCEDAIDAETVPENFLGVILARRPDLVLFVDAAEIGGEPGSLALAPAGDLAARVPSTHAPSLLPIAQILGVHGIRSWVLGIQPGGVRWGEEPGPEVTATARAVLALLAAISVREEVSHG